MEYVMLVRMMKFRATYVNFMCTSQSLFLTFTLFCLPGMRTLFPRGQRQRHQACLGRAFCWNSCPCRCCELLHLFFYQPCCLWVIGELEHPFNVMFFCISWPLLCISWPLECNPFRSLSTRQGCPYIVLSFSDPLMVGSLVCMTTGESLG